MKLYLNILMILHLQSLKVKSDNLTIEILKTVCWDIIDTIRQNVPDFETSEVVIQNRKI